MMKTISVTTTVDTNIDVYDIDVEVEIGAREIRKALRENDIDLNDLRLITDMLETFIDDYDLDTDTRISATVAWNRARQLRDMITADEEPMKRKIIEFGRPVREWWIAEASS